MIFYLMYECVASRRISSATAFVRQKWQNLRNSVAPTPTAEYLFGHMEEIQHTVNETRDELNCNMIEVN